MTQDEKDTNLFDGTYRGFGIAGVQIRPAIGKVYNEETGEYEDGLMYDDNERDEGIPGEEYNNATKPTPEGMRFVTSMSEVLLSGINGIGKIDSATSEAKTFGVEYGYVVGTESRACLINDKTPKRAALFPQYCVIFPRNPSGFHRKNALSCEKIPRFLCIPLFIKQALISRCLPTIIM